MSNPCDRTFDGANTVRLIDDIPCCVSCGYAISEHPQSPATIQPSNPPERFCEVHGWDRIANKGECPTCYRAKRGQSPATAGALRERIEEAAMYGFIEVASDVHGIPEQSIDKLVELVKAELTSLLAKEEVFPEKGIGSITPVRAVRSAVIQEAITAIEGADNDK